MTTETTTDADADVVAAAGVVRAAWEDNTDEGLRIYRHARLRYEWPELAIAVARLSAKHEDALACPSEYDTGSYDSGTAACYRGRDHEGPHEGEGIDGARFRWEPERKGVLLLDVFDCGEPSAMTPTQHCDLNEGHTGDHSWAAEEQERAGRLRMRTSPCAATRPYNGARTTVCTLPAGHFGQHHNREGNVGYQWDGDGRTLPALEPVDDVVTTEGEQVPAGCPSSLTDYVHCKLTAGHAGNHENGDRDWQDD